jgi:hypothetical protein
VTSIYVPSWYSEAKEIADCEAAIRSPPIRYLSHFRFGRQVVEAVRALDRSPECEVVREEDIGPVEGDEQEAARGP